MRIPNEIVHKESDSIEFTIFDDRTKKTARKITDFSLFMSWDPQTRQQIRSGINRKLNRALDEDERIYNVEDLQ